MMDETELQRLKDAWVLSETRQRTHSEQCYLWHPGCAVAALVDEIEQLRGAAHDYLASEWTAWRAGWARTHEPLSDGECQRCGWPWPCPSERLREAVDQEDDRG